MKKNKEKTLSEIVTRMKQINDRWEQQPTIEDKIKRDTLIKQLEFLFNNKTK